MRRILSEYAILENPENQILFFYWCYVLVDDYFKPIVACVLESTKSIRHSGAPVLCAGHGALFQQIQFFYRRVVTL